MRSAFGIDVGRKTLSMGVTLLEPNDTANAAFRRVDRALYEAKKRGRDTMVVHQYSEQLAALVERYTPEGKSGVVVPVKLPSRTLA